MKKDQELYIYNDEYSKYPSTARHARAIGLDFYYTGVKCKRGHLSLQYTSSGNCMACIEEKRHVVFTNYRGTRNTPKRSKENQTLAEDAFKNGFTTYNPISPCPKGHYERFIGNNNCVQCSNEINKNRGLKARWNRIKKIYGISESDYNYIANSQENKCAICSIDFCETIVHIDHCHESGEV